MVQGVFILIAAVAGSLLASILACIPGLHIYNVMGLAVLFIHSAGMTTSLPPDILTATAFGMLTGYALLSTVPAVLLSSPDESAAFTVLPSRKYLLKGRGFEAVMLTSYGSLAGIGLLLLLVAPIAAHVIPKAYIVLRPHQHWILWCVIAFMLLSEWPRDSAAFGQPGWRRFLVAWRSLSFGLLTFALSGLLGFVLIHRSPIRADVSFQNLMPAFVGLFTLPWLLLNIISRTSLPTQTCDVDAVPPAPLAHGILAGGLGGGLAAFFPVVTGGVGSFLAGHASALRDDRAFLVSQGVSRTIYYVGGFLLLFVPGLNLTRGGAAALVRGIPLSHGPRTYAVALAAIALGTAVALAVLPWLTRTVLRLLSRVSYRRISGAALALIVILVALVTGPMGIFVALVATGIGLLPPLFGTRRMNCLGVILLPLACNMSGVGHTVAMVLGLG